MENLFDNAQFGDKYIIKGMPNDYVVFINHIKLNRLDKDYFRKKYCIEVAPDEFVRYIAKNGEIRCVDINGKSFDNEFYDVISKYEK